METIIEVMKYSGYEFIEERPEGRLLFYETEMEETIQLWIKENENPLKSALLIIIHRAYDHGLSNGRYIVQSEIKKLLDI